MKSKWLFFDFLTLCFPDIHAGTTGAELGAALFDPIGDLLAVDRQRQPVRHIQNSAAAFALPSLQPRQEVCAPKSGERQRIRVARNKARDGVSQVFNEDITLAVINA
jgi:hypothetical protein